MNTLTRSIAKCLVVYFVGTSLNAANVRDFGAKGDGVADDTKAIVRAVDEAKDGVLEFPLGDYRLTRTIQIDLAKRGRTSLNGHQGVGRVIMAGPGPAFRFSGTHTGSADPNTFKPGEWQNERMPQIDGLEIVGAHAEADGVEFYQVMQPTLRGVSIREVRHGVHLVTRDRNVLIDSCHIYNCRGVGIYFDQVNLHQAIIHGCHISYCKGGGIKVAGSEIRNLQITGNDIEYNFDLKAEASADVWLDVTQGSVREGTIASNTIQAKPSPGGANIRFVGNDESPDKVGLWTITGNLISSQNVNVHLNKARGVVLTGNTIFSGQEQSVLIENCHHIVVGPHSFDHNPDYKGEVTGGIVVRDSQAINLNGLLMEGALAGSEKEGGALDVRNCREVSVTGCQIFDPKYRGAYVSGSQNVLISGCTIMERSETNKMVNAVQVTGKSKGVMVINNVLSRGTHGQVAADAFNATVEANSVPIK